MTESAFGGTTVADPTQSWEARHERACTPIKRLADNMRQAMQFTFPQIKAELVAKYPDLVRLGDESLTLRHCNLCTPPPELHTCSQCGWQTQVKWRYGLHVRTSPKWCQDVANKRIQAMRHGLID